MTKVMMFIDGNYLRTYVKEIFKHDELNYDYFSRRISGKIGGGPFELIRSYFYDGVPDEENGAQDDDQISYLKKIDNYDCCEVRSGRVKRSRGGNKQKGVDTLIAIDMITKAFQGQYDWAVLVTGDDDFLDVVKGVKETGARVMGVFFEKHISEDLKDSFDKRFILDENELSITGYELKK